MNKVSIKEAIKIIGFAICTVLVLNVVFMILSKLNIVDTSLYNSDMKELAGATKDNVINFVLIAITGPIVEELIYRYIFCGGCYKILNKVQHSEWIIIFVSSLLFGLGHGNAVQMIYASICGCILGSLYFYPLNKTFKVEPNLLRPILFHVTFNSIGYLTYIFELTRS